VRAQRNPPLRRSVASDQPLDRLHRRHDTYLFGVVEVLEQAAGLALRAMIERCEGLVPLGGQRNDDLPAIAFVASADDQVALFKAAQDAAEIAVIDIQRRGQYGRGGFTLLGQFVQHPRLR
jgi:hypothetical protein